jgi:hypothetical protein
VLHVIGKPVGSMRASTVWPDAVAEGDAHRRRNRRFDDGRASADSFGVYAPSNTSSSLRSTALMSMLSM